MRKGMKFSKGGRAEAQRDRRLADIESDYQKALARGKSEKEARAKREQRLADARDDYAKRTGADRTETRAAERAAEQRLTAARRSPDKDMKAVSVASEAGKPATTKVDITTKVDTPTVSNKPAPKATPRPAPKPVRRAAPKPAPKAAPKPAYDAGALRRLESEVTRPGKPRNVETPSVGKRMMQRSAQRQQGQIDELGGTLRSLFSPFLKNKYSDKKAKGGKVKAYAKGGKVDGAAVRGKTRGMRKK